MLVGSCQHQSVGVTTTPRLLFAASCNNRRGVVLPLRSRPQQAVTVHLQKPAATNSGRT